MESETERKIEETVKEIVTDANMDEMTEFKLRLAVASRLGIDLSSLEHKKLIRRVLEVCLLSTADETTGGEVSQVETGEREQETVAVRKGVCGRGDTRVICKLSDKRNVAIHVNGGKTFLSIGELYQSNDKQVPAFKGINLTNEQWSVIKTSIPAIEEAIGKLQSKSRSQIKVEQDNDVSNAVTNPADGLLPVAISRDGFLPVEISRFDGKNYLCWASQMESLLKHIKLAHVLIQPCPSISRGPDPNPDRLGQAKSAEQKWTSEDYLCRHHILSNLSDHLYHLYSKKSKSAKELWEELRWVYLYEESGSRRSQVKKYIEFKMVEERPVLDQVQQFNAIADSIVNSGMFLDENFHTSVILSKLPLSWKSFCIKMLEEENLPVRILMEHLKAEEEFKNTGTIRATSYHSGFHVDHRNHGTRVRDMGRQNISWKRKEPERDSRPVIICENCGKKGHLTINCWGKKSNKGPNEKQNMDHNKKTII